MTKAQHVPGSHPSLRDCRSSPSRTRQKPPSPPVKNQPDGREKSPYLLRPPAATASGFVDSSRLLLAVPPESDNRCARLDRRRASPWHSARIQLAPSWLILSDSSSGAPVVLRTTFAHDSSCSTAVLVSA